MPGNTVSLQNQAGFLRGNCDGSLVDVEAKSQPTNESLWVVTTTMGERLLKNRKDNAFIALRKKLHCEGDCECCYRYLEANKKGGVTLTKPVQDLPKNKRDARFVPLDALNQGRIVLKASGKSFVAVAKADTEHDVPTVIQNAIPISEAGVQFQVKHHPPDRSRRQAPDICLIKDAYKVWQMIQGKVGKCGHTQMPMHGSFQYYNTYAKWAEISDQLCPKLVQKKGRKWIRTNWGIKHNRFRAWQYVPSCHLVDLCFPRSSRNDQLTHQRWRDGLEDIDVNFDHLYKSKNLKSNVYQWQSQDARCDVCPHWPKGHCGWHHSSDWCAVKKYVTTANFMKMIWCQQPGECHNTKRCMMQKGGAPKLICGRNRGRGRQGPCKRQFKHFSPQQQAHMLNNRITNGELALGKFCMTL